MLPVQWYTPAAVYHISKVLSHVEIKIGYDTWDWTTGVIYEAFIHRFGCEQSLLEQFLSEGVQQRTSPLPMAKVVRAKTNE